MADLHGILVVDKPPNMTSAAVVARVKRALGAKRVGHTGTLDPMATGVLPLCVGEATKIAGYLLAADKAYDGQLCLGVETDTLDREGQVVCENPGAAAAVDASALRSAMSERVGDSEQVPPMYSALKKGGRRLHQLARAGVEVEREPRPIHIESFELRQFDPPRARFSVSCSKGTYVRSLVADVGASLGCGAHLTELRRTRSGAFDLEAAVTLETLEAGDPPPPMVGLAEAIAHLPQHTLAPDLVPRVANGQNLMWRNVSQSPDPLDVAALVLPGGELLALVRVAQGRVSYERVFRYGLTAGS